MDQKPEEKPKTKSKTTPAKPARPSPVTAIAKPPEPTGPSSRSAAAMREIALRRLDELIAACVQSHFYGHAAVEVLFVGGQPKVIRHRMDGTDKP